MIRSLHSPEAAHIKHVCLAMEAFCPSTSLTHHYTSEETSLFAEWPYLKKSKSKTSYYKDYLLNSKMIQTNRKTIHS